MAVSCPQCRAAVVPGMRACQFCGAPVEYVVPDSAENRQAESPREEAVPDQPASAPLSNAASPLAQKNGSAKSVVKKRRLSFGVPAVVGLIIGAFLLFMAVRLLSVLHIFGPEIHPSPTSTSQSPNAASASGAVSAAELGVDIYPGAQTSSDVGRSSSADSSVVSATFVSSDSMDKVIEFYRTRMVGQTAIYASGNGVVVSISPNAQESVLIAISPAQSGGKTRISISNTTAKSAD